MIVILDSDVDSTDGVSPSEVELLDKATDEVTQAVEATGGKLVDELSDSKAVAVELDPKDVDDLEALDAVEQVFPAPLLYPVAEPVASMEAIGASALWGTGMGGGYGVAVLDTGVDSTHPALAGKISAQACFSGSGSGGSLCPPGGDPNPAADCTLTDIYGTQLSSCKHGTHVAGIVAAEPTTINGTIFGGVAPAADVVAVQIFSSYSGCGPGGVACPAASSTDVIRALDWLYANRTQLDLASVNMSIGDQAGTQSNVNICNADVAGPSIRRLRDAGVVVAVAAGNDSVSTAVSWPSCINGAVSVASASKSPTWNTPAVSSFSNGSPAVSVIAPGSSIASTLPGNAWESWSGTSMATPHVAAAAALWRDVYPSDPMSSFIDRVTSGMVTDSRNGLSYPMLNFDGLAPPNTTTTTAQPPTSTTQPPTTTTTQPPTTTTTAKPKPPVNHGPLARFEELWVEGQHLRFSGWAFDPDGGKPGVLIIVDGQLGALPPVNKYRPGVWRFFGSKIDTHSGWSGSRWASKGNHTVCTYLRDATGTTWTRSECRQVTVK